MASMEEKALLELEMEDSVVLCKILTDVLLPKMEDNACLIQSKEIQDEIEMTVVLANQLKEGLEKVRDNLETYAN